MRTQANYPDIRAIEPGEWFPPRIRTESPALSQALHLVGPLNLADSRGPQQLLDYQSDLMRSASSSELQAIAKTR